MLSAFVLVDRAVLPQDDKHRARVVVRTLAALVNLVVSDIVADATIVTRPDAALAGIDDIAGCTIVEGPTLGQAFAQALPAARRPLAFVLRAGFALDNTAAQEILERIEPDTSGTGALVVRVTGGTLLQRIVPHLAPAVGLIAPIAPLRSAHIRDDNVLRALTQVVAGKALRVRAVPLP